MDTDHVHPDAIRAALEIGIARLESESERQGRGIDWSTFNVRISQHPSEEDTSRMSVTAKTLA
jgi:hypothetical protein